MSTPRLSGRETAAGLPSTTRAAHACDHCHTAQARCSTIVFEDSGVRGRVCSDCIAKYVIRQPGGATAAQREAFREGIVQYRRLVPLPGATRGASADRIRADSAIAAIKRAAPAPRTTSQRTR
jgi:hypothetical protein